MADIVVNGNTSGAVTLSAPAVAGTVTVTLPSTTGTMAVLPTATGVLAQSAGGTGTTTGYYGFKNRIINGAMVIDQRNAGASVTPTVDQTFTVDRWKIRNAAAAGRFSVVQSSTSAANFPTSALLTVTTTSAPSGAEFYAFAQDVEGYNMADFGWGTANAQSVTVSFQVRSSLTGTYCVSLRNNAADRSYVAEFTINSANTFETKTITIPAITTGTWLSTNGTGILFMVCLGSGSTREGTAGSWQSSNIVATSNQVDWINTSGATFYITGVQLEKGSTATSFDYRPYGTELALCQRYYYKIQADDTSYLFGTGFAFSATNGAFTGSFPVTMRVSPSALEQNGTAAHYTVQTGGVDRASSAVVAHQTVTTQNAWAVQTTVASGQTTGLGGILYGQNVTAYLGWSAEL